ncbi:MAG: NAD(P)-binding domain-containing protein [candidate division WOR-3 bacterium]
MANKSLGFIGGGRVTRIVLGGLKKAGRMPEDIIVSDINAEILQKLKIDFPEIVIAPNDNTAPAEKEIIFLAVHPPAMSSVLNEIKAFVKPTTFLVSLAPKVSIKSILDSIKCFPKIARMIPNAGSIVNQGYNPIAFADTLSEKDKQSLLDLISVLGECPVVPEQKLEAYAVITGMGPTYFWFQLNELKELAKSFGLSEKEAENGITKMVVGTVKTLFESGLNPAQVMDLIPVRPLAEKEGEIKNIFRSILEPLYKKLKGIA